MWLLESDGDVFGGKRLWLRPGKKYLFGRTASEPGQHAISHKTISRKHLVIQVDRVTEGDGMNLHKRTTATIEDLGAKMGTLVNGVQIRGQMHVLVHDTNEIKLGSYNQLFRIFWRPIVFSFSFTAKELRADPWAKLRQDLEQLDIKYTADYDMELTTYVVAKKRNTSKGLRALINGKHIVTEQFIDAIVGAATSASDADGLETSRLERDLDGSWPNPLQYLPPRGEEPSDKPVGAYAPDERRREIFDGYTFVFYEKKQYENLFAAITNGKGKALFKSATPNETNIDDFIRYVKGVAGEKGLGEFEDGSEGKGVVVVRYMPAKEGPESAWFKDFYTAVALRLDHRPIEQSEFLDAILAIDPARLRRPLEVEQTQLENAAVGNGSNVNEPRPMDIDVVPEVENTIEEAPLQPRARRGRKAIASRFKGFDVDLDVDSGASGPADDPQSNDPAGSLEETHNTQRSQRKRPAAAINQNGDDLMEDLAPTAAAVKRRRIAQGVEPVPAREPTPPSEPEDNIPESPQNEPSKSQKGKGKQKKTTEIDNLFDLARQRREEAEARAKEERARLAAVPEDGIDYEEIRRLAIVEECGVRQPQTTRTRDQDIADGRWDPRWNGRKNFKKFRKQGDPQGRQVAKVIVSLEPVKAKEYGIGDDYWLEDTGSQKRKNKEKERESQSRPSTAGETIAKGKEPTGSRRTPQVIGSDSEEDDVRAEDHEDQVMEVEPELPRTRVGKAAQKGKTRQAQTQSQSQAAPAQTQTQRSQRLGKRAAAEPATNETTAKKPRVTRATRATADSDDSDDELQFRFGRRR